MNLPDILNVAIGLVVVYFLLSSIASLLLDIVTTAARYREEILYVTVNRLLAGAPDQPWDLKTLLMDALGRRLQTSATLPRISRWLGGKLRREYQIAAPSTDDKAHKVVQRFWDHPKINSLASPGADAPDNLEPVTFAQVIVDIAIPRDAQGALPDNRLALERALAAPSPETPRALLDTLRTLGLSSEIPPGASGEALWKLFTGNVARWFNEAGGHATELYRRTMQRVLLALGFVIALLLNVDTVRIVQVLSSDKSLAETTAAFAQTVAAESAHRGDEDSADKLALTQMRAALGKDIDRLRELDQLGFPIGWRGPSFGFYGTGQLERARTSESVWKPALIIGAVAAIALLKLVGLLATALAVAQGAPFWYDLMRRLLAMRKGAQEESTGASAGAAATASGAPAPAPGTANGTSGPTMPRRPLEIGHDLAAPATSFDPRKAYWLACASAAAYSPKKEAEALVIATWKFHEFHFFDQNGTQGFCARDDKVVLIAFRGTEVHQLEDILADVHVDPVSFPFFEVTRKNRVLPCEVHTGFSKALAAVEKDLAGTFFKWIEPGPDGQEPRVFLTGHSLGGALATLLFARLAYSAQHTTPVLYTFGCPKVGNEAFTSELDRRQPERMFRLINETDAVPLLPPLEDYHHAGNDFFFDAGDKFHSEISGLGRLLGYASTAAAKSIKEAGRKAAADHGMARYINRCEMLAKAAS